MGDGSNFQVNAGVQVSAQQGISYNAGVSNGSTSVSGSYGYNPWAAPGQYVYSGALTINSPGSQTSIGGGVNDFGTASGGANWQQGNVSAGVGGNYNVWTDNFGVNGHYQDGVSGSALGYNNNPDAGPTGAYVSYISPSVQLGAGYSQDSQTGAYQAGGYFNDGYSQDSAGYSENPDNGWINAYANSSTPSQVYTAGYSSNSYAGTMNAYGSYTTSSATYGGSYSQDANSWQGYSSYTASNTPYNNSFSTDAIYQALDPYFFAF